MVKVLQAARVTWLFAGSGIAVNVNVPAQPGGGVTKTWSVALMPTAGTVKVPQVSAGITGKFKVVALLRKESLKTLVACFLAIFLTCFLSCEVKLRAGEVIKTAARPKRTTRLPPPLNQGLDPLPMLHFSM